MAAQGHHVSVMELLIKHGADINDTNKVFASNNVLVSTMLVVISSINRIIALLNYRNNFITIHLISTIAKVVKSFWILTL